MAIAKRLLGRTGVEVTALGLGGVCWNLEEEDERAVEVVHRAIDLGITYFDTASGYKDSERRLGLALRERDREPLFVASKCLKRSGDEAKRELADSFAQLGVETIDLMQLHAIDEAGTLDEVLGPGGALRLIEEYRKAGKIRFVGLTGHTHPAVFQQLINAYEFDTILNPSGPVNRVWNDFCQTSLADARARGMGTIGMKVMAYGQVPRDDLGLYMRHGMDWVDVVIAGMDTVAHVEENVRLAEAYKPLSAQEEELVLAKALELVPQAKKELWWLPERRLAS